MASEIPSLPEATMANPRPAVLKRLDPVVGDMYDARLPLPGNVSPIKTTTTPAMKDSTTTTTPAAAAGGGGGADEGADDQATTASNSRRTSVFEAVSTSMKLQGWAAPQYDRTTTTVHPQERTPIAAMPSTSPMIPAGCRVIPVSQITQNYFRKTVRPDASLLGGEKKKSAIATWLSENVFSGEETLPMFRKPAPASGGSLATPLLGEEGLLAHEDVTASMEESRPEEEEEKKNTMKKNDEQLLALACILIMAALCNLDHGAMPAVISDIRAQFKGEMSYIQQTFLGSLVYMGVLAGTFFASVCTSNANGKAGVKWILMASLLLSSAAAYGFTCAESLTSMGLSRFLMGFFQAIPVFYLPTWVEALAPEGRETRWMIYSQLGGIAGSVIGYFLGGVLSPRYHEGAKLVAFGTEISWRTPFFLQSLLLLPLVAFLTWLPEHFVDVHSLRRTPSADNNSNNITAPWNGTELVNEGTTISSFSSSSTASDDLNTGARAFTLPRGFFPRLFRQLRRSASNFYERPLYLVVTLAMSTVYFVITGIQFWLTEYMVNVLSFDRMAVVILSSFCFLTAPITGVWCGGMVCDECEKQHTTAVRSGTLLAGLASMLAVGSAYSSNLILFTGLLWGTLFYGGSLIPVGAQLLLSQSAPRQERSASTATTISQFSCNVLGWFVAPVVIGGLMESLRTWQDAGSLIGAGHRKDFSLSAGFTMILCLSIVSFGFFGAANFLTRVPTSPPKEFERKQEEEDVDVELLLALNKIPESVYTTYQMDAARGK